MKTVVWIILPCIIWAEPPLTLDEVLAKSKVPIQRLQVDIVLADGQRQVKDASAFLRESPIISVSAGPRKADGRASASDQTVDLDAPLMLKREPARKLAADLDIAAPVLYSAASLENRLAIHKAFLDAWHAERVELIRAEDDAIVRAWLQIAAARGESGADPAFQLELVRGELIKSRMDLEEAKRERIIAWNVLRNLAELPESPQTLEHHHQAIAALAIGERELEAMYRNGAIRRSCIARQNLEIGQANLHAAIANSRWSIHSSYSKESSDRIAKIGLAYKLPRIGEQSAIKSDQRAKLEASRRNAETALAELDTQFKAALQALQSSDGLPNPPDIDASIEALTLRLQEGKDRPSEAISARRQLIEIRLAELRRYCFLCLAEAELLTLIAGEQQ